MPWIKLKEDDEDEPFVGWLNERKALFRCDHDVPRRITVTLRRSGYDVVDSRDGNLEGAEDATHHSASFHEHRTLITADKDFLDEQRYPRDNTFGCVIIPVDSPDSVSKAIDFLLTLVAPSRRLWRGSLVRLHRSGIIEVRDVDNATGKRITDYYRDDGDKQFVWEGPGCPPGLDRDLRTRCR